MTRARAGLVTIETVVLRAMGNKQNFDSKPRVSNFHCKKRTIFDVGSIRSWSQAVFSSFITIKPFVTIFFGGLGCNYFLGVHAISTTTVLSQMRR